jgi:hypothetical protein
MIAVLFWIVFPFPCAVSASASTTVLEAREDPEVDAKIASAGGNIPKLLELATAYSTANKDEAAKKVYKKILEIDATNEAAHKALNHQFYDKKWFESFAELSKYKRDVLAKMKGKGLARYKDEWVAEADVPYLNMGWTKDEKGVWTNPYEMAQLKQQSDWRAAHYRFRDDDNSWIAPEDVDKWAALKFKCGDEWLEMAKADEYHSKFGQWWQLDGAHFVLWTTCDWVGGNLARWNAEQMQPDLVRIFGVEPTTKPHFLVLNNLEQYNRAAGGTPPLVPESEGISSLHGAYFADSFFDVDAKPPQFVGCGVSYWDRKDDKLKFWGPYWLRWAAAQSWIDAIDPSWGAVGEKIAAAQRGDNSLMTPAAFWGEKKIPRWLRYGAASYVERYMKNPEAAKGADPWDMRAFAFGEVKKAGGLHKLDDIFAFTLDINRADNSSRLYHEAGLLVAFLLDGAEGNKDLAKKHEAFKTALKSGSKADVTAAVEALQKELVKNEAKIKKFAGL